METLQNSGIMEVDVQTVRDLERAEIQSAV